MECMEVEESEWIFHWKPCLSLSPFRKWEELIEENEDFEETAEGFQTSILQLCWQNWSLIMIPRELS